MQLSLLEWGGINDRTLLETIIYNHQLSPREGDVARGVSLGMSNMEIANRLGITEKTIKYHLTNIFRKCKVSSRVKLALMVRGI